MYNSNLPEDRQDIDNLTQTIPDVSNLMLTQGVIALQGEDDIGFAFALKRAINTRFMEVPDFTMGGGDDKEFFTVDFRNTKLFVAMNEVHGLTVMLPEEY